MCAACALNCPCLAAACLQGHFPEPQHDPVIQIASLVTEFGKKQPAVRNIMTLKSCAPITGAGLCTLVALPQRLHILAASHRLGPFFPTALPLGWFAALQR